MLLFLLSGQLLLRFADRQFLPLLFQLPPRFTRFEPLGCHPKQDILDDLRQLFIGQHRIDRHPLLLRHARNRLNTSNSSGLSTSL